MQASHGKVRISTGTECWGFSESKEAKQVKVHFKLWVEEKGRVLFGEGRLKLLSAIKDTGSLAGAARELEMSYRAAWGRLKASEERLGFDLVERSEKGRRAVRLTKKAERLLDKFADLQESGDQFAASVEKDWVKELAKLRR